jgi:hypothetical protein
MPAEWSMLGDALAEQVTQLLDQLAEQKEISGVRGRAELALGERVHQLEAALRLDERDADE